jgi:hypothetical protein
MTELRRRTDEDMIVRGLADRTREPYLGTVTGLARFYRGPPLSVIQQGGASLPAPFEPESPSGHGVPATWWSMVCGLLSHDFETRQGRTSERPLVRDQAQRGRHMIRPRVGRPGLSNERTG